MDRDSRTIMAQIWKIWRYVIFVRRSTTYCLFNFKLVLKLIKTKWEISYSLILPFCFFKQIYILVDFLNFSWFCKKYIDLHYILKYFIDSSRLAGLIDNTAYNTPHNFIHNYDNKSLYHHFCFALRLTANNTPYNKQIENYYKTILHQNFYFAIPPLPAKYDKHKKVQTSAKIHLPN